MPGASYHDSAELEDLQERVLQMRFSDLRVLAALAFRCGRRFTVDELAAATDLDAKTVRAAARRLEQDGVQYIRCGNGRVPSWIALAPQPGEAPALAGAAEASEIPGIPEIPETRIPHARDSQPEADNLSPPPIPPTPAHEGLDDEEDDDVIRARARRDEPAEGAEAQIGGQPAPAGDGSLLGELRRLCVEQFQRGPRPAEVREFRRLVAECPLTPGQLRRAWLETRAAHAASRDPDPIATARYFFPRCRTLVADDALLQQVEFGRERGPTPPTPQAPPEWRPKAKPVRQPAALDPDEERAAIERARANLPPWLRKREGEAGAASAGSGGEA